MTTTIQVRGIGLAGEIKDILPENMPLGGVTSARNCRIESQSLRTFSNARIGTDFSPATVDFAQTFWRLDGDGEIAVENDAGTISIIFIDTTGGQTDITPVAALTDTNQWYAVQVGEWFILTNGVEVPQYTTSALPQMVDLPGWPSNYQTDVIEVYKNFIVAVGVTKDAVKSPLMIKWSHPVSPGDTTTFWDFTDPTLLAGENILQEPGREIIAAHPYRDTCMIYMDRKTWRMDQVGGEFVMNFQKVFDDDGILSAHGWTNAHGEAYVFGRRDIYKHDGHNKTSLTDLRLTKYIYDRIDFQFDTHVEWYPKRNEVFFLSRTQPSGDGDFLLLYNTSHDAWTESLVLFNGDGVLSSLTVGPRLSTGNTTYDDWGVSGEVYTDFDDTTYADLSDTDETITVYGTSKSQAVIYDLDYSGTDPEPTALFRENLLIEHRGIDLDEDGTTTVGDKIIYLNRIYPQIHGSGSVRFTFGLARVANEDPTDQTSVTFNLDDPQDYAVDVRMAGRYLSYRIEGVVGQDVPLFSFTGMDLEVAKVGEQ